MTGALWLFAAWVVVWAAWLTLHLVLLLRVLRSPDVQTRSRWASLVPLVTPFVAWRAGMRKTSGAWAGLAALYLCLRALG
jgi:hypothetical protein